MLALHEFSDHHMNTFKVLAARSFPNNTSVYTNWTRCFGNAIRTKAKELNKPGEFPGATELVNATHEEATQPEELAEQLEQPVKQLERPAVQPEKPGDFPDAIQLSAYIRNCVRPIPRPKKCRGESMEDYKARRASTPWAHNKAVEMHTTKLTVARALRALMAAEAVAQACHDRESERNDDEDRPDHWGDPVDWENRGERIGLLVENGDLEALYQSVADKDPEEYARLLNEFGDDVFE